MKIKIGEQGEKNRACGFALEFCKKSLGIEMSTRDDSMFFLFCRERISDKSVQRRGARNRNEEQRDGL